MDLPVGVLEARSDRRVEAKRDEALIRLGDELGAHQRDDQEARDERAERDPQHGGSVTERPAEQATIDDMNPVDAPLDAVHETREPRHSLEARSRRVVPHRRQHRIEREADEEADQHGDGDRQAELEEEAADDAAHERDRHEHGDDRKCRRHDRRHMVPAERQVANDVLAHDNRIVDQKTDAKRQRHQRQEVERESERIKRDERRDHRERQREAGDDRAAPAVQKQKDDEHGQCGALDDRVLDTVDALLDGVCGREGDAQVDVRGQPFLQRLDGCLDVVTGLDDVGVLRLLDVNRDRRLAVHARKRRLFLFAVDDLGDLRQIDRAAALLGDDDPAELCRILDLPLDAHDRIALSARNAAGRHVLIASHGNSLRALVKYLDKVSDEAIVELNIPTGIPLVYELNEDLTPIRASSSLSWWA